MMKGNKRLEPETREHYGLFSHKRSRERELPSGWSIEGQDNIVCYINSGEVMTLFNSDSISDRPLPLSFPVKRLESCGNHVFYQTETGDWFAAGVNVSGELGIGSSHGDFVTTPVEVRLPNLNPIVEIVTGPSSSFFCDHEGQWFVCGNNEKGSLGLPESTKILHPTPFTLPNKKKLIKIVPGLEATFYQDESLVWYGSGLLSHTPVFIPIPISLCNGMNIKAIKLSLNQIFIQDEQVQWYQVGDISDGTVSSLSKLELPNGKQIIDLTAGIGKTFLKDESSQWYAMGQNAYAELGLGFARYAPIVRPEPLVEMGEKIDRIVSLRALTYFKTISNQWLACGIGAKSTHGFQSTSKPVKVDFALLAHQENVTEKIAP